jgi:heme/copper-type cytochrome/quinol oxidase subunit 3
VSATHPATAHDVHAGAHATTTGLDHRKMLWWAFLGSDCMFFGTLIGTSLVYKGRDKAGPPPHTSALGEGIINIPLTSVSAFVLLMSSLAMVLALAGITAGNMRKFRVWIFMTALLGSIFVGFQVFEFTEFYMKGLSLQGNLFGASFFTLTGFHGAHVTVGVMWLLSLLYWSFTGELTPANAINVEICGLYWHFVDVVWIAIFAIVY